jgi:hypothetical protein
MIKTMGALTTIFVAALLEWVAMRRTRSGSRP